MIRFGLCCLFLNEPIKFRTSTAKYLSKFTKKERLEKISNLCLSNTKALRQASEYCIKNGIGCFRVNSRILPLKTHPEFGYKLTDLPEGRTIKNGFIECGKYAEKNNLRFTFHPDQFILLSSPDKNVTIKSIDELNYQAEVSEWIGADVINIHGGGGYQDKQMTLKRIESAIKKLSKRVKDRLTIENDDRVYTPEDLLPLCEYTNVPFVYDIHHHRCLRDRLSVEQASTLAVKTWDREPIFHISSPRLGWKSDTLQHHADFIDIKDFPEFWRDLDITLEVEAKAKELAVIKLQKEISKK